MIVAITIACLALVYGLVATSTGAIIRRAIHAKLLALHQIVENIPRPEVQPPEILDAAAP
jgi:hypothetical protein